VLDVVYELLEDETARVRNAAAAVLVNFFDVDEEDVGALPEVEDARMRPLLTKIMTRLQAEETLAVLEQLYPAICE
jgi:hypothetical protein